MKFQVKRLQAEAHLPEYAHPGDAGLDIRAAQRVVIGAGQRAAIPTGLAFELPPQTVGLVWDKSGRAVKDGLKTMAGVVDQGFRGEFLIVLLNTSEHEVKIQAGEKIAQLLIQPVIQVEVEEVDKLDHTSRGQGGFGSTGLS